MLLKIVATRKTESPTYQSSNGLVRYRVERGVHQRVGFDVLLARHVREVNFFVVLEQPERASVETAEMVLLHPPLALELFDHEHRVGAHADNARRELARRLEPGNECPVLGHVVGGGTDALAHRRESCGRRRRRVEDDRANGGGPRIPAGATVAVDHDLVAEVAIATHGTKMQPQLSQYEIVPSGALRMLSTSVDGIDR